MRSKQHTLLQAIHMRLNEERRDCSQAPLEKPGCSGAPRPSCGCLKCNTLTGMTALLTALLTPAPCLHTLPRHWSWPGGIRDSACLGPAGAG